MPYLKVTTNKKIDNKEELLGILSKEVANVLGKPELYVMVSLEDSAHIHFQGSSDLAAFVELRSIGLPESQTKDLSKEICQFLEQQLNIPKDRVYINFLDIKNTMWGWKGDTF
ncbi:MAG: phenylpyruvate tautomerase MIF-related protein [Thermotogota bacterium]|nr:phenylpyruvate tautomerase MIF-related protein [Thermotogota bacterium]